MGLSYDTEKLLKELVPVFDENAAWFGDVMRCLFYVETYKRRADLSAPRGLLRWMAKAESDPGMVKTLESVRRSHETLQRLAQTLAEETRKTGQKPEIEKFDALMGMYNDFIGSLRRLERDCLQEDTGRDTLTGLRNLRAMTRDMAVEMERRARDGKPFSLVLARIDNYEAIRDLAGEEEAREVVKKVSVLICKGIRAFDDIYRLGTLDDAYRLSNAEFILSFKHADMAGGKATVTRLRQFMKENPVTVKKDGKSLVMTMSYCVAEPVPGESVDQLLTNMRADLSSYEEETNAAIEYVDQSPLQRYLKDRKEPGGDA